MRSPCVCVNSDSKAVYQSLHRFTIIPPILSSATLVTRSKSWELPTNCRNTMLERRRISKPNVGHCRDDIDPPSTRKPSESRESAEPKYNTRLPTRTSIWRPQPPHPTCFSTCQRRNPSQLSPDPTLLHIELLTACQWVSEFRLGQQTAERYRWIDAFAVNRTGSDGVF